MNNVLFVPSTCDTEWLQNVLPGTSPTALPVAGRKIIDYMLEFARRYDIMFIEVLDWHFSEDVAEDFSELTRTGYPVFYMKGEGSVPRGLADIEGLSTPLTQTLTDGLDVAWGLFAGHGGPVEKLSLAPVSEEELIVTPPGVYRRVDGKWMRVMMEGIVVKDVTTWHSINLNVLHKPELFTLPGYSAEKDVHLGRNVVLEKGTNVNPPALLMDNVWCARNVELDDVIVGSGAVVSEGTTLRRTVVCDDTFVGEGLDFDGKIICGNRIVDAATGVWADVEDEGVAHSTASKPRRYGWGRRILRFLLGDALGGRC